MCAEQYFACSREEENLLLKYRLLQPKVSKKDFKEFWLFLFLALM